jgi:MHS family shikimate/dehydroshikimate transporter-like MFS transporter
LGPDGGRRRHFMAVGVFALVNLLPKDQFLAWGWRLPFLISIALIAFGLYIRAQIAETPVFREVARHRKPVRLPVVEAIGAIRAASSR